MASRPELKEEDETSFVRFYRNLPEKNDDTIRIFDRGDYYSAHGDDAVFIARTVSLSMTSLDIAKFEVRFIGLRLSSVNLAVNPLLIPLL